jgi:hypothetical protein
VSPRTARTKNRSSKTTNPCLQPDNAILMAVRVQEKVPKAPAQVQGGDATIGRAVQAGAAS